MSIASSLHADAVNKSGKAAIKEMEALKATYPFIPHTKAIDECIEIVRKKFTGWTE